MKIFTHYVVESEGMYLSDLGFGYGFEPDLQFVRLFNSKDSANRALASLDRNEYEVAVIKEWITNERD